jgi:hypothetical protein
MPSRHASSYGRNNSHFLDVAAGIATTALAMGAARSLNAGPAVRIDGGSDGRRAPARSRP